MIVQLLIINMFKICWKSLYFSRNLINIKADYLLKINTLHHVPNYFPPSINVWFDIYKSLSNTHKYFFSSSLTLAPHSLTLSSLPFHKPIMLQIEFIN